MGLFEKKTVTKTYDKEIDFILWAIVFTWNVIKVTLGMMIVAALLVFEIVIFPITTIYYFVKSRQENALE